MKLITTSNLHREARDLSGRKVATIGTKMTRLTRNNLKIPMNLNLQPQSRTVIIRFYQHRGPLGEPDKKFRSQTRG